jgi:predicted negative regulator of RcsB-dependent stress response
LRQGDLEKAREFSETLFSTASGFKSRKYMAVAHKLRSEIAIAERKPEVARGEYQAALDLLDEYPVPVIRWRVLAGLGKLLASIGDSQGARSAFAEAKNLVDGIAANVSDEALRKVFMESEAVKEVVTGAS